MIHEITIKAVLNGYVVKVGCQTLAFDDRKKMLAELGRYYADPEATEKSYRKAGLNAKHTFGMTCENATPPAPTGIPVGAGGNYITNGVTAVNR